MPALRTNHVIWWHSAIIAKCHLHPETGMIIVDHDVYPAREMAPSPAAAA
ncbi:MAG: hypothetical protein JSR96_02290 [Proteobacteria bacterium]|nr:hypothetical protein [Pseudomonadota bacterium]